MYWLKQIIETPLSVERMIQILHVPVIMYSQLHVVDDIRELCDNHLHGFVLLYAHSFRDRGIFGHYVAVCRSSKNVIQVFAQYGRLEPDELLLKFSDESNIRNRQTRAYLNELLIKWLDEDRKHKVEFNHYHLQSEKLNVNTCGHHCISRLIFNDYGCDKYGKMMTTAEINPDEMVALAYKRISEAIDR